MLAAPACEKLPLPLASLLKPTACAGLLVGTAVVVITRAASRAKAIASMIFKSFKMLPPTASILLFKMLRSHLEESSERGQEVLVKRSFMPFFAR
jgi:hypothetical protein